jgi:hypothetical protein
MFDGIVLPTCNILHIYCTIYLQCRDQTKTNKKGKIGTFTVCRHTTKGTKVICCVLAHGKGDTCRQSMNLGVQFWAEWSFYGANAYSRHTPTWHSWHTSKLRPTTALVHAWSGSESQTHADYVHTADHLPCLPGHTVEGGPTLARSRGRSAFIVPCTSGDTQQSQCRDSLAVTHGKLPLPSLSLSCVCTRQTIFRLQ